MIYLDIDLLQSSGIGFWFMNYGFSFVQIMDFAKLLSDG